jgi:hypothetical protein
MYYLLQNSEVLAVAIFPSFLPPPNLSNWFLASLARDFMPQD